MTIMELQTIDSFFDEHLLKVEYFNHGREERQAALRMAERDVASELGRAPGADNFLEVAAVGEQTIHLLRHPAGDGSARVVAEKVEGVGSRSYAATELPEIAPRARRYLRALLGATVRTARG